jgi:hypothetical protein
VLLGFTIKAINNGNLLQRLYALFVQAVKTGAITG